MNQSMKEGLLLAAALGLALAAAQGLADVYSPGSSTSRPEAVGAISASVVKPAIGSASVDGL